MTEVCPVPKPFDVDLLQLAIYAAIAFGFLKLYLMRDWEGWWRPIVAALLPTLLIPAALTAVLNAFGMPTPLYRVEDLRLYIVVSDRDLCRNLAVAEYVYQRLESNTIDLVNAYATATTVLTIIDGILTVVTGGAWQALKYATAALKLTGLQNWVNALTQPILAVLYIFMSLTVIWHIVVFMAKLALWAPFLISVGVPLVAVSRTKEIGGVAVAIAAISVAVSHFAFLTAWDVYGLALWGGEFAKNLKDAADNLQIDSGKVPFGAPQLAVFGEGVFYIVYNNTYHASWMEKAMEKNPFLATFVDQYVKDRPDLKQLAEERKREFLDIMRRWFNKTSLYVKNVTNGVLAAAGPAVGAVEWGVKEINASAWYGWLDMNVTASVVKCDSLIPPEVEPLFKLGREHNSNVTAMAEYVANETCRWLREVNMSDTLVFSHVGRYRTLSAVYLYNLTAKWGNATALLEKSSASGIVGMWHWVVGYGPDGERCYVAGNSTSCDYADVTAFPGRLRYEASNDTLTWTRPSTKALEVNFTARLEWSKGQPYRTDKIPLYRKTEVCKWCEEWQCDANGNCWCVDEEEAYRDWWEEYRAEKVLDSQLYVLPRPYAERPWRFLTPGVKDRLGVEYTERKWKIEKYWRNGDWYPQEPPYCDLGRYFTPETPYKYVILLHVPEPYYRIVYYWAWLSGANVTVWPSRQLSLPDTLPEEEVPPSAKPEDGLPADYLLWGAEHETYCDKDVLQEAYNGWRGMLQVLPLIHGINKEGLFTSLAFRNATAAYYQTRRMPEAINWLIGLIQGTPGQWAIPALQEGLRYARGEWHGYL